MSEYKADELNIEGETRGLAETASPVSDEDLMLRYANGDSVAFKEIYNRYKGPVFRFILRSVNGDRAAAEDMMHEVMMKVIGAAQRYKPSAKFNTWLFRIARNTCIDASRRKKFEPARHLSDPVSGDVEDMTLEDVTGDGNPSPEELAANSETSAIINTLMEAMNPQQKEVFLLREIEGLSFSEISDIVGCAESTVKSRMRYAINYLAEGLRQRGIER